MRTRPWIFALALALATAAQPFAADFFCKRYDFSQEQFIRLDASAGPVTVRDIKFEFPAYVGPKKMDIKGHNVAKVSLKNYGKERLRIHLAVALFDGDGNMVGCGTTGSKVGFTNPGEEESFYVSFDYVKSKLSSAKVFYLTLETEPAA